MSTNLLNLNIYRGFHLKNRGSLTRGQATGADFKQKWGTLYLTFFCGDNQIKKTETLDSLGELPDNAS